MSRMSTHRMKRQVLRLRRHRRPGVIDIRGFSDGRPRTLEYWYDDATAGFRDAMKRAYR